MTIFGLVLPATASTIASSPGFHVHRDPRPSELIGLDGSAFDTWFHAAGQGVDWQWSLTDSNVHGWIIGQVLGDGGVFDTGFVYHTGFGVVCCHGDGEVLNDITNSGLIVGSWFLGLFGSVDEVLVHDDVTTFNWDQTNPYWMTLGANLFGPANQFLAVSEDGNRIETNAGLLYLNGTPEPATFVPLLLIAAVVLWKRKYLAQRITG